MTQARRDEANKILASFRSLEADLTAAIDPSDLDMVVCWPRDGHTCVNYQALVRPQAVGVLKASRFAPGAQRPPAMVNGANRRAIMMPRQDVIAVVLASVKKSIETVLEIIEVMDKEGA